MSDHPITPPYELVEQLESAVDLHQLSFSQAVARAYAAGADQELNACCDWIYRVLDCGLEWSMDLRSVRRPKPPSLKEQALAELHSLVMSLPGGTTFTDATIRRALEQLDD